MKATSEYLNLPKRTMLEVIQGGAVKPRPRHKACAWCASDPRPVALVCGRWVVCCEEETCKIDVQATGATPEEAWSIWDTRI